MNTLKGLFKGNEILFQSSNSR
ncbi:MAG: hypothetical protein OXE78_13065 [Gammaproteobacteria bacterium]|nr:hypothetical protein [Gammaproteobacteria bacterium]